jgi:hypothetical protein
VAGLKAAAMPAGIMLCCPYMSPAACALANAVGTKVLLPGAPVCGVPLPLPPLLLCGPVPMAAAAAAAAACLLCASAASMDRAAASPSSAATQVHSARQSGV